MTTASRDTSTNADGNVNPRLMDLDGTRVLVADDQADVLEALRLLLKPHGCHVRAVSSPAAVTAALGEAGAVFDLLLMDLNYARDTTSGDEGLELVARVKALDPHLPVVVMTAWSTVSLAVATMREGVGDFVQKPWENARLLETIRAVVATGRRRRRAQRLEADARDVQQRLLGIPAPRVPGYDVSVAWRLAEGLGGDCSHVAALSDGRLAVAIADVCGKGTPAALLMASVKASLEELVAADPAPRALCARLARTLAPRLGPDRFVSLVYAVLDPARGTLAYANAGHPPGLIVNHSKATLLESTGPPVGMFATSSHTTVTIHLHEGDIGVLVTDGVSESIETDGVCWCELAKAALADLERPTAEQVCDKLMKMAQDGEGPAGITDWEDDQTAVVFLVDDSVSPGAG